MKTLVIHILKKIYTHYTSTFALPLTNRESNTNETSTSVFLSNWQCRCGVTHYLTFQRLALSPWSGIEVMNGISAHVSVPQSKLPAVPAHIAKGKLSEVRWSVVSCPSTDHWKEWAVRWSVTILVACHWSFLLTFLWWPTLVLSCLWPGTMNGFEGILYPCWTYQSGSQWPA